MDDKKALIDVYAKILRQDIGSVSEILNKHRHDRSIADFSEQILTLASDQVVEKWLSDRKSLRTLVAYRSITDYPSETIGVSLLMDGLINILDDLFDEKLGDEAIKLFIVEMIRVLSGLFRTDSRFSVQIADYLQHILCIAVSEHFYREEIKNATAFDDRVRFSIKCYEAKGFVIDIFFRIPLTSLNIGNMGAIVNYARLHRSLHLLRKDIIDIEHDRINDTETPVSILKAKDGDRFRLYVDAIAEGLSFEDVRFDSTDSRMIADNLRSSIETERKELSELLDRA